MQMFNCQYFYRGAVLIMGALTLNTLVCALLYHPVSEHMKEVPVEGIDNAALTLDEPIIEAKMLTDGKTEVPTDPNHDRLTELSKYLEKNLDPSSVTIINENEKDQDKFQDVEYEKSETTETNELPTETVVNLSALSRTNSTRVSKKNFHLSRQHSIVSEMGPIALSPRNNVPGLFRRFFKTPTKKIRQRGDAKTKSNNLKIVKDDKSDEAYQGTVTINSTDSNSTIHSSESSATISTDSGSSSSTSEENKFFDFSVLRDPLYLIILISNCTSAISNTNFMILLPSYAISEGFDKNMSALLLSIVSALDLVGRIGGASLSDIDFVPKYYYFVVGLGLSGIALALLPMATSYLMLSLFCGLFGLSSGMYIGITTVILADMLGTEKLSSSYGISLFVNGVLQLVGPPVCGAIFERVGTYKPIFLAFGIILILGTALWAVVPLIKRKSKEQQTE